MSNYFEELSKVDCSKHIEKKGRFSYLSWPFAVSELRKRHPDATWSVVKSNDGLPYVYTESGCFVEVAVTVNGVTLSQIHPVLDNNNRTIPAPNAFQINTSIQRCLVKAIALHGLGLYIYAGEDLPEDDDGNAASKKMVHPAVQPVGVDPKRLSLIADVAEAVKEKFAADDVVGAFEEASGITDSEEKQELWKLLPSNVRSAITKYAKEERDRNMALADATNPNN